MAWTSPIYYYPYCHSWYTFKKDGHPDTCYVSTNGILRAAGDFHSTLRDFEIGATKGTFILVTRIGDTVHHYIKVDEGQ